MDEPRQDFDAVLYAVCFDMREAVTQIEHLLAYQPDYEHRAVLKAIQTTLQARIARTVPHIQASDGLGPIWYTPAGIVYDPACGSGSFLNAVDPVCGNPEWATGE